MALLFLFWAILVLAFVHLILTRAQARGAEDGELPPAAERNIQFTWIVAHRAGAAAAPENTLAALERSIAAGADMAEIDVRMTGDGTLVVMHDDNLKRTTGLDRNVWETDSGTVENLDAGSWYSDAFAGEGVPTLEEMLSAARGHVRLMIELKCAPNDQNLVERAVDLIRKTEMEEQCILACTELGPLQRSKALAPTLETVYIGDVLSPEVCGLDYVDGYSIQSTSLTKEAVEQVQAVSKSIYAWTVNTTAEINRVLGLGVDGLVTDDPELAVGLRAAGSYAPADNVDVS